MGMNNRILISMILLTVFMSMSSVYALSGWSYYRDITIDNTGNSNVLTDYQVLVTVDTATIISEGKMNSDCSDIRFTESDGVTELSYWIEDGSCNSANTRIWVKVPSIPASSTYTIQMWYGNSLATSESNATAVFIFYEDFSSDLSKWSSVDPNCVINSTSLNLTCITDAASGGWFSSDTNTLTTFNTFCVDFDWTKGVGASGGIIHVMVDASNEYRMHMTTGNGDGPYIIKKVAGTDTTLLSDTTLRSVGTYHTTFCYNGSTITANIYGNIYSVDDSSLLGFTYLEISHIDGSASGTAETNWDNIILRQYVTPEPITSVGVEQTDNPQTITVTGVENKTYYTSYFNITYYAIDDKDSNFTLKAWFDDVLIYNNETYLNATILQYNTNLLEEGQHNFTVYAIDSSYNRNYEEILFTVDDYVLINYSFTPYQYEDEVYNYKLELLINEYLFNKSNMYFIHNGSVVSYEYSDSKIIIPLTTLPYTYYFNTSMDELEVNIVDSCIPNTICYGGVDVILYLNGNVVYSNTVYDGWVIKEKYDTIEFKSKGINVVSATFIAKKYDGGFIANVTNPLIITNATNINFEWLYDKGVNETVFSNTTTLMYGYYLEGVSFDSKILEGNVKNITYTMFCINDCNKHLWTIKTYITNVTGQNTQRTIEVNNSLKVSYDVDMINITDASIETDGDKYQDREITGELIISGSVRPLGSSITTRVYGLYLRLCEGVTYPNKFIYEVRDEENNTVINDFIIDAIYDVSTEKASRHYTFRFNNTTKELCLVSSENLPFNIYGDHYYDDLDPDNYVKRRYILNISGDNVLGVNNIVLYLLRYLVSYVGIVRVVDEIGNPLQGYLVKVMRYYPTEDKYISIYVGYTDFEGKISTFIEPYTATYRIIVEHNNKVVADTDGFIIGCGIDSTCPPFTVNIKVSQDIQYEYLQRKNILYDCSYSDTKVSCTISDITGLMKSAKLIVYEELPLLNYTIACKNEGTGSSLELICNDLNLSSSSYIYYLYAIDGEGKEILLEEKTIGKKSYVFNIGLDGLFLTLLMILLAIGVGYYNPAISVTLVLGTLIFSMVMGFLMVTISSIIAMVVLGVYILWRMR